MRLATSCVLACYRPDGTQLSVEKSLQLIHQAGFQYFDINFWDWSRTGRDSPFLTENWRTWAEGIAEYADSLGVQFVQGHAYTYSFLDLRLTQEEKEYHEMLTRRSMDCCHILGVKNCVVHPDTDWQAVRRTESSRKKNLEYLKPLLEYAIDRDMELAVENMCNVSLTRMKYCAATEELLELVSSFLDDRIGICWDFEHGEIMDMDQRKELLEIGHLLKATHVSDTHSKTDTTQMHVHPMLGNIQWEEIIRTLKEINYQGYFSYEISNFTEHMPDMVLQPALKLSYEIGQYLVNLEDEENEGTD